MADRDMATTLWWHQYLDDVTGLISNAVARNSQLIRPYITVKANLKVVMKNDNIIVLTS